MQLLVGLSPDRQACCGELQGPEGIETIALRLHTEAQFNGRSPLPLSHHCWRSVCMSSRRLFFRGIKLTGAAEPEWYQI
jgi:hypothetical protein